MNINEVANHAALMFPQRSPMNSASDRQTDPETGRVRDTAPAPIVQTQEAQSALSEDPSAGRGGIEELQTAVEKIQEFIRKTASDIKFSIDEDSGRTVVKVIDRETQEIIRQIPSQEMLDLAQALDKLQGLLIRQEA
ncbi:MAG: flagellar protein FlaG [Candidatus Accumulibacter sp.]|jgi:flagellar protein FlaG|nr:flagellar protein FlaG [Accumulibacter sp.]